MNNMNNKKLFVYCISKADINYLKYTEKYSEYRRQSEKCGKKLQDAERLFNAYKENVDTIDTKILKQYYNLKDELFNEQLKFLNIEEKKIIEGMMNPYEDYQYNQKWHWVIGYYLYSVINSVYTNKKIIDWEQEIHPWRPKGRILNDILMYLWLIEISKLEIPKELESKIDEIEGMNCKHANIEKDKELISLFKNIDTSKLWNDLSDKVNKYMEERKDG